VGPLLLPVFHLKSTTPRLKLLWQQHFVHTLKRQQPQIYLIWTINMPECQTLSNAEDEVTWPHECKTDLRDEFMTDIDGLPRIQQILQNMQQNVAGDSIYPFPHCCSFFTPAPFGPSSFFNPFSSARSGAHRKGITTWVVCLMLIKLLPSKRLFRFIIYASCGKFDAPAWSKIALNLGAVNSWKI